MPFLFETGIPIPRPAELLYNPFTDRVFVDQPGLGIVNAANGVAPGTLIELNVAGPLSYWNESLQTPVEQLTIASPDGIGTYVVDHQSDRQTGLKWAVYPGRVFWEEDGFFFLDASDAPNPGLYGVFVELASPDYTTSEPFLVPFVYDPQDQFSELDLEFGIEELIGFYDQDILGDFNHDGTVDALDIDELTTQVQSGDHRPAYDLTEDGLVTNADREFWVEQIAHTYFGDADLNGQFNSTDIIVVLQSGEYEDSVARNSGWATGDWDGDQEFATGDIILAFQSAGYEQGPRAALSAVPEPNSLFLVLIASLIGTRFVRTLKYPKLRHP